MSLLERVIRTMMTGDFRGWRSPEFKIYNRYFGFTRAIGIEVESNFARNDKNVLRDSDGYVTMRYGHATSVEKLVERLTKLNDCERAFIETGDAYSIPVTYGSNLFGDDAISNLRSAGLKVWNRHQMKRLSLLRMSLAGWKCSGGEVCQQNNNSMIYYDSQRTPCIIYTVEMTYLFDMRCPIGLYKTLTSAVNAVHLDGFPTTGSLHLSVQETPSFPVAENIHMHTDLEPIGANGTKVYRHEFKYGSPFLLPQDLMVQILAMCISHKRRYICSERHKRYSPSGHERIMSRANKLELSELYDLLLKVYHECMSGKCHFSPVSTIARLKPHLGDYETRRDTLSRQKTVYQQDMNAPKWFRDSWH